MLNYIWLALIVIGVLVAVGNDWNDLATNKYHNGEETRVTIHLSQDSQTKIEPEQKYHTTIEIEPQAFEANGTSSTRLPVIQTAEFVPHANQTGTLTITLDEHTPSLWKELAAAQKKNDLTAFARWENANSQDISAFIKFEPIKFVKMNAVTNDGIIKYAKTAVELAIGLIGIMALWLGLMKIAEQSGLVANLAKALRPITTRLFPDVPADHPAMGAMIMNISANMLGLANAATPLGIKAMEELNKLNKKAGTATDAMCTFLVINTSNVQLIPATVIAIRASAGSANATEILGPVIVATFLTLIIGIATAKLLARLPVYRKQLEAGN